jgi:hypothetical protein
MISCGGRIDVEQEPSPPTDDGAITPKLDADAPAQTKSQMADDAARQAARACRGDWGRHGLSPVEGCNCRSTDFGTPCADNAECDGQCLADAPSEIVVDEGPPRRGYWVGQCSEFVASFGCHSVLADGYNLGAPLLLDQGVPMRCLD